MQGTGFPTYTDVTGGAYFFSDATWFIWTDMPTGSSYQFRASSGNNVGFSAVSPVSNVAYGATVAPPPSGGSIGIYADYDNWRVLSDFSPTANSTAHPNGNLAAGCFWNFNTFLFIQDFACYSSAIHFPMSGLDTKSASFNLAGKTIDRAYFVVSVNSTPLSPTNLYVGAIGTGWNTNTLNGNQSLPYYNAGASIQGSPVSYGGYAFDVTTMVQQWANGGWVNNGILLDDAEFVFPYASIIRTSFFYSTDSFNNNPLNKPTLWVDYH